MMLLGAVVVMCEEAARLQAIEAERSEVVHVAASDATGAACTRSLMPRHIVTTDEALVTCDVCKCILVGRAREASAPRSWPSGWPPFAVLRRAFYAMGVSHRPSTVSVERRAHGPSESDFARRKAAKNRRHAWARAVKIEMLETITISEVAR